MTGDTVLYLTNDTTRADRLAETLSSFVESVTVEAASVADVEETLERVTPACVVVDLDATETTAAAAESSASSAETATSPSDASTPTAETPTPETPTPETPVTPGDTALAALERLGERRPPLPVVCVASAPTERAIVASYEAGAVDCVDRTAASADLLLAHRVAAQLGPGAPADDANAIPPKGDDDRPAEATDDRPAEATDDRPAAGTPSARRAMLETVGDGAYALDADDRFLAVNEAFTELTGYDREELLGRPASLLAGGEYESLRADLQDRLPADGEVTLQTTLQASEGTVPVEARVTTFPLGDGERGRVGVVRDVSDRRRLESELDQILERVTDAFFALDEEWRFTFVNDCAEVLLDADRCDLLGESVWEEFSEAVDSQFQREYERAMATQEATSFEEYYPPLDTWFQVTAYPSESGLSVYFRDVSARKRREERLAALTETVSSLPDAETTDAVLDIAVDAAGEVLDLPNPVAAVYDDAGDLRPQVGAVDEGLFASDEGTAFAWRAFVESERRTYDAEADDETAAGADDAADTDASATRSSSAIPDVGSAVVVPLGRHGVLAASHPDPDAIAPASVNLAGILGANVRSALDRADRETTLREQRDALQAKNRSLERLQRINTVIREITGVLVRATTDEEIAQSVCEKLVASDAFRFAWIGRHDRTTDEIVPRASAGVEEGYLDAVTVSVADRPEGRGPTGRAVRTDEVAVQNSILTDPPFEPWRKEALKRGYQSSIAVPLVHRDARFGVLNLYAADPHAFGELEQTVLAELGTSIANAMLSVEQRRALLSERSVELELRVDDLARPVFGFVDGRTGRVAFAHASRRADDRIHLFFTVEGASPETVQEAAETRTVESVTHVAAREDGHLFECTLVSAPLIGPLLDRGAVLQSLVVEDGIADVHLRVLPGSDVREFVNLCSDELGEARLLARRELDEPVQTREQFEAAYLDRLTDRQAEVVRTAYFAGFFEWPRESTGQDVAAMLGVTQPTVNRHIRASQRKLFDLLFGE